jgi:hypothetical protein
MRCCASETVSAGHVRMLFSGFPGALFLRDPIASGAFRGLLPSESLFVILANTRSIFDITSWREIGSAVMAPLPVELGVCRTHRSLEVRSSLRCARACGRTSRVGSTKVMRGLLPWRRVDLDRACTFRISRMSPDVVVMRDQKLPLAGRGVSLTRVRAWCLCGAQTDEHGDRLRPSSRMPVERTASATSSTARRVAALLMPDSVSPPTPCAWSSPRRPGGMVASCSRLPLSWRRNRAGTDGALAMPSRFSHRTHWSLSPAKRRVGR